MKAMQAIKKMVALGIGLTMVGATVFGASAVKLSDYPAPFIVNGTPASNLAIIVGDQADGSDVVGAIDIIQSLQSQAVIKTAGVNAPSQLVVEGDAVEIGSTSDLLEIGEVIGNVRETLTEVDLDMLKGGQVITDEGSTEFNQYLRFPENYSSDNQGRQSGTTIFDEDERDRVGHYLYFKNGDTMFQWELEFEEGLESEVEGDDLKDLEDEDITILGQPFVIVDTDVRNGSNVYPTASIVTGGSGDLTIEFIGGAVSAVLGENDKETYVVDGKEYEVEVLVISETAAGGEGSVKFRINGEITDELEDGETDVLADGTQIGIRDILATGKDIQKSIVQFYLGAYKVSFQDTNTSDSIFRTGGTEVNEETIEMSSVMIKGQFTQGSSTSANLDGSVYEVQNIKYNLSADAVLGNMYVAPGTGIREQLDEPEGMLTPNWDIRYEGLMDTGVTLVRVDAAGDDEYDLEFTNQEGIFFDFPLASNEEGNSANTSSSAINLKYGDDDDDLWFTEFGDINSTGSLLPVSPFSTAATLNSSSFYISDDDFFVVSNCNYAANDDTCFAHVLRYDSVDSTNRQLTFTDLGTGTREVTYDSTTFMADLVVGGITYKAGVQNVAPYNLVIDLNGDNALTVCTEAIVAIQGEGLLDLGEQLKINETAASPNGVYVSVPANTTCSAARTRDTKFIMNLTTLQKEFDEATTNEEINITIQQSPTVAYQINLPKGGIVRQLGNYFSGMKSLEENDDIDQALSGYGVFFEIFDPESGNEAEDLTIEYPLSQRGSRVFVTGGIVTTQAVAGMGAEKVMPIQLGAAKLASEVSDVTMYNAIVVGGPCANPIAASLLGNPEPCYESVAQNKAMIKLFEQTNGNVALLINGRTATNSRHGARAVATGAIKSVTGMEAEVTGTTLSDVTVKAI